MKPTTAANFLVVNAWNVQGKTLQTVGEWIEVTSPCADIITLQEVGGIGGLTPLHASSSERNLHEYIVHDGELEDYFIFGTNELESYLGQVILLSKDGVEYVSETYRGERVIGVRFASSSSSVQRWVFSVHLPHSDNTDDIFEQSVHEIRRLCNRHRGDHAIFIGDFNVEPCSARVVSLDGVFRAAGFTPCRAGQPTRFGRYTATELDYAYISRNTSESTASEPPSKCLEVINGSRKDIGSDHDSISLTLASVTSKCKRRRRRTTHKKRCARWSVNASALRSCLCSVSLDGMNVHGQWELLKDIQRTACYRTPTQKYRDPPEVKQLCKLRRESLDHERTHMLTKTILAKRAAARIEWLRQLESRAAEGDPQAIRYLRQRQRQYGDYGPLLRTAGSPEEAADAVRTRFRDLFMPDTRDDDIQLVESLLQELQCLSDRSTCNPFTNDEVSSAVLRLKTGRVSGMSGVSAELMLALWADSTGRRVVMSFLNSLLCEDDAPPELNDSFVTLVPKVSHVASAQQLRPINLVETVHKMYCFLITQRLQEHWPRPPCQLGGLPGSQVLDPLAAAHFQVQQESSSRNYRIYLNADVQSAFDSLSHRAVAEFVAKHTPHELSREALQLLRVILNPQLHFSFQGEQWTLQQLQGVQQGHSHSSLVFSFIVGTVLHSMLHTWKQCGEDLDAWLYVDDLLLCFSTWEQARKLVPQLEAALAAVGLVFNPAKTEIMSHDSKLREGRLLEWEPGLLNQCKWTTCTTYLRKPLRHHEPSESIATLLLPSVHQLAHSALLGMKGILRGLRWHQPTVTMRLLRQYVGSTWLWFAPLLVPSTASVRDVHQMHTTMTTIVLDLYIPDSCPKAVAMSLHRLRRRVAILWLDHFPDLSWKFSWRTRRWTYLGNLLRRPSDHAAAKVFQSFMFAKRTVGGPYNTTWSWFRQQCLQIFPDMASELPPEEFLTIVSPRASNKQTWRNSALRYFKQVHETERHPFHREVTWESWRAMLNPHVDWAATIHIASPKRLIWLDTVEGMRTWHLQDDCPG